MQVLLDIKEEKFDFFMSLFHDYKKYVKAKVIENEKEVILKELKQSVHEINLIKRRKIKSKIIG